MPLSSTEVRGAAGGHTNFMPVTYEGTVKWEDHSSALLDDDYTLNVSSEDSALYNTTREGAIHIEFNSDETVDNWDGTGTWWEKFHHDAVDHETLITNPDGSVTVIHDGNEHASAMIDGSSVIVLGELTLDTDHDGLTELHPVYAMFVHLNTGDVLNRSSSWAFFVRNWGDQGQCGSDQQYLYSREQKIKVKIPDVTSLTSDNISKGAQESDNLDPMEVSIQPSEDGMLLTFTLLAPENQSWFVGDLTFENKQTVLAAAASKPVSRAAGRGQKITIPETSANLELEAKINRLPDKAKKALEAELRSLTPKRRAMSHVKPLLLTGPAKMEQTYHRKAVRVANSNLVRSVKDRGGERLRVRKSELISGYLEKNNIH